MDVQPRHWQQIRSILCGSVCTALSSLRQKAEATNVAAAGANLEGGTVERMEDDRERTETVDGLLQKLRDSMLGDVTMMHSLSEVYASWETTVEDIDADHVKNIHSVRAALRELELWQRLFSMGGGADEKDIDLIVTTLLSLPPSCYGFASPADSINKLLAEFRSLLDVSSIGNDAQIELSPRQLLGFEVQRLRDISAALLSCSEGSCS